jgi:hypothetical protein
MGMRVIMPRLSAFTERHPLLRIELDGPVLVARSYSRQPVAPNAVMRGNNIIEVDHGGLKQSASIST